MTSNTLRNKALTHRELHPEKSPLSQLVLELCPTYSNHHIRQNQIIRTRVNGYLSLNREYTVAEYLTTVTDPKLRKSLSRYGISEHRLAVEKARQTDLAPKRRLELSCTSYIPEHQEHTLPTYYTAM